MRDNGVAWAFTAAGVLAVGSMMRRRPILAGSRATRTPPPEPPERPVDLDVLLFKMRHQGGR